LRCLRHFRSVPCNQSAKCRRWAARQLHIHSSASSPSLVVKTSCFNFKTLAPSRCSRAASATCRGCAVSSRSRTRSVRTQRGSSTTSAVRTFSHMLVPYRLRTRR
jgi:hypothetical protein